MRILRIFARRQIGDRTHLRRIQSNYIWPDYWIRFGSDDDWTCDDEDNFQILYLPSPRKIMRIQQ
jgi:hypothetical protein